MQGSLPAPAAGYNVGVGGMHVATMNGNYDYRKGPETKKEASEQLFNFVDEELNKPTNP